MNMKTAKSLIQDVQNTIHPNSRFIKNMRQIENPNQFGECLSKANANVTNDIRFHSTEFGQVIINKELIIHGNRLVELKMDNQATVDKIFDTTYKRMNHQQYSKKQFWDDATFKKERINFETQRNQTLDNLRLALRVENLIDYEVNEKAIFHEMDPHFIDRIDVVMQQIGDNGDLIISELEAIKIFAEKIDCSNVSDYIACMEIMKKMKTDQAKKMKSTARKNRSHIIINKLIEPNSSLMEMFRSKFIELKELVAPLNAEAKQPFKSDMLAVYHFFKHGEGFKQREEEEFTPKEYFEKVKSVFDVKYNSLGWKPKYTQDGKNIIVSVQTEDGMFGIFIKPLHLQTEGERFFAVTLYKRGEGNV